MKTKVFEVGGSIRDSFLNISNKDRDFVVMAKSYNDMKEWILSKNGKIFLENENFFTIRCNLPEIGAADFVLGRKESHYSDNRRPDKVEVAKTIKEELSRRDFTINAIAKDIETGEIVDPFGGREDIENGLIRCVGSPWDRFEEDSLRIMRGLRFFITKNLWLHGDVSEAMKDDNLVALLSKVSAERIREELFKCFSFDTLKTLNALNEFEGIRDMIFDRERFGIWLKPTREIS